MKEVIEDNHETKEINYELELELNRVQNIVRGHEEQLKQTEEEEYRLQKELDLLEQQMMDQRK